MRFFKQLAVSLALLRTAIGTPATSQTVTASFTNIVRFLFDVEGNQIDAYGSKINFFEGKYYLYGNSFANSQGSFGAGTAAFPAGFGIKSYSSVDLVNWSFEGFLYDPYSKTACDESGGCGRPHIVYNAGLKKYILWANAGSNGYQVATSSSPSSGFVFAASTAKLDPKVEGLQPGDFAVEAFGDQAYLVFSALNFAFPAAGSIWPPIEQTLHISPLTSDFTNTTGVSYPVRSAAFDLIDQETESPDIFIRNGTYYIACSNTCGYCDGSIGLIYRSQSIRGPWTRQIISAYSCNGQVEGILPLTDPMTNKTSYVWHSTSVPGGPRVGFGGHIFQPLQFNADGSVQDLDCASDAAFSVSLTRGTGVVAGGVASTATDGSPAVAAYSAVCDSDTAVLYQTWTASKSGTLKEVSVNIAKSAQQIPLTIDVFKFDDIANLTAPEYRYTLLGTQTTNATYLSFVFNTTTIPTNVSLSQVSKGDHLGFSIIGPDIAPYCHLEYDTPANSTHVLLQQSAGQNSWRGLSGKVSPISIRQGKGIKFFATIE